MSDINRCFFTGRLTRDAEAHGEPGPRYALRFSIACNGRRKNRETGQWEDAPSYFNIVAFGNYAAAIADKLGKGVRVALHCEARPREYEAKDGTKRHTTDYVASDIVIMSQAPRPQETERITAGDAYAQDDIPF